MFDTFTIITVIKFLKDCILIFPVILIIVKMIPLVKDATKLNIVIIPNTRNGWLQFSDTYDSIAPIKVPKRYWI